MNSRERVLHHLAGRTRLHIYGNTRQHFARMGRLGYHMVDLDSLAPLAAARVRMGSAQVLLSNMNPVSVLCHGTPELVTQTVAECHAQAGPRSIVGAGCEVPRDTPDAYLHALVGYAKSHRP